MTAADWTALWHRLDLRLAYEAAELAKGGRIAESIHKMKRALRASDRKHKAYLRWRAEKERRR